MLPTPSTDCIKHLFNDVYPPQEDTFALLDSLEQDISMLRSLHPKSVVEIGSGSGTVSQFMATQILQDTDVQFYATDINPMACEATRTMFHDVSRQIHVVVGSMFEGLDHLVNSIDVLLFNPPYVPTDSQEFSINQARPSLDTALSGGVDGMELTNVVLDQLDRYLSPTGLFYLVTIHQNKPEQIIERMKPVFDGRVVLIRKTCREKLIILCFSRSNNK